MSVVEAAVAGLNPSLPGSVRSLARTFASARPFRHVVIDSFFDPAFAEELDRSFPPFEERLALNEDGKVGRKAVNEKLAAIGPAWARLDRLVQSAPFRALIGEISGVSELRYDPWYFGGGTHENRHGQDLDPHVDFNYHPITRQHRRLNLIVYFERNWDPSWGGALDLHADPRRPAGEDDVVRVPIGFNRAVLFETTERSWHGFERIDLPADQRHRSRRSFALYYYTDTRPAEETAKAHSTIYVERRLPERFAPGRTLDDSDVAELRQLLDRRDQHLERLYRQVTDLTDRLQKAEAPPSPTDAWEPEPFASLGRAELEARCRALSRQLAEIYGSNSWRVTAPLRRLVRLLGRGR